MKGEWQSVRLGAVATLQRGFDLPHRLRRPGTVPIVTSSGLGEFHSEARVAAPGVVTGRYGTIGEVFFVEQPFWPLNTTLYVRDFHENDPLFVSYLLRTIDFQSHSGKSGVPGVNRNDLHELIVARPPLSEQRAIAAALRDVDALLAGLDKLIAKKRDLKQAAMQKLLTGNTRLPGFSENWESTRLGSIGWTYGGLVGKTKGDFGTGTARYITFLNVLKNVVIDTASFEAVNVREGEQQNAVAQGDLLFNGSSETPEELGLCAVLTADVPRLYLNSFCFGFRLHDQSSASGPYLAYFFRSGVGRRLLYSLAQGATRHNLSKKALLARVFALPRLEEQKAIAEVLSDMDTELAFLELRREKIRAIKQGMMQELLTGKTRLV